MKGRNWKVSRTALAKAGERWGKKKSSKAYAKMGKRVTAPGIAASFFIIKAIKKKVSK